jgi:hypothetical protein
MLHLSYRIGIAPAWTPETLKAFGSGRGAAVGQVGQVPGN